MICIIILYGGKIMKREIIVGFILIILTTSSISYSAVAFSNNKKSQLNNEKGSTNVNDPLTIRAEVKTIGDSNRIFSLRVYATNTWDEQIIAHWHTTCNSVVFYPVQNTNKSLLVYESYKANIFQFIPTKITFKPGEEKLIQRAIFFGISNWILYGLDRGYKDYIPDFPRLPDGDYQFRVSLNPYQINNEYKQYLDYITDTVNFHFGAS
jgi:hypothetical protein